MKKPIQQVQGKHFYSHLVETESLIVELHTMNLSEEEKTHLISLVDSSLHHTVLDAVLSELSEEDKRTVLKHLAHDEHDKVWTHLNSKVDNIEDKIKQAAEDLKKELHSHIKEAKEK